MILLIAGLVVIVMAACLGRWCGKRTTPVKQRMLYHFDIAYRQDGKIFRGAGTSFDADSLMALLERNCPNAKILLLRQQGKFGYVDDEPQLFTSYLCFLSLRD